MIQTIQTIFKIPDLRRKILYTLFFIFIYRLAAHIPIPFIDPVKLERFASQIAGRGLLAMIDMFSGRAFSQMTILALGIMPYISASIILQLLTVVWPKLEKIAKEGEAGKRKITQYTRYGTVVLTAFQSIGLSGYILSYDLSLISHNKALFIFTTMLAVTAGTTFLMWLGEKISEYGIGNGISLIIAFGIIAAYPFDIGIGIDQVRREALAPIWLPLVFLVMVGVSILIILIQEGSRNIPIQHAKRIVGRRMVGGVTTYLPLKVNTGGVIPVIFASAILTFPGIIFSWLGAGQRGLFFHLNELLQVNSAYNFYSLLGIDRTGIFLLFKAVNTYTFLYAILTIFFCYFYTAIIFNPVDTAENLKKYGSFIPGIRPGKATADHIDHILSRITLVGAVFLVTVALLPNVFYVAFGVPWQLTDFVGGTGLIIVVGVVLDTMKQVESHLLMRHYEGFRLKVRTRKW